jgi:hypothetical protein
MSAFNNYTIDLQHAPMTMHALMELLNMIALAGGIEGGTVTVVNGASESGADILHRLELAYIAAHEARVRTVRERDRCLKISEL